MKGSSVIARAPTEAPPPLWPSQEGAIAYALERRGSIINAHMGHGKTRVAIETVERLRTKLDRPIQVLVLAPRTVVSGVWPRQFLRYARTDWRGAFLSERPLLMVDRMLREHTRSESGKGKAKLLVEQMDHARAAGASCIVAASHHSLLSLDFMRALVRRRWDALIVDELHRAKAPKGVIAKKMRALTPLSGLRLGLTGTLMPHSPLDVWAQCAVIDPRVLGSSYWNFRAPYIVLGGYKAKEVVSFRNLPDLTRRLGALVHVPPSDVKLPAYTDNVIEVELGKESARVYADLERDMVARVRSGEVTAANGLVKLLRLQQVTSGHTKVEDATGEREIELGSEKLDALEDLLTDCEKEPVVVLCLFKRNLARVQALAKKLGRPAFELSGRADEHMRWKDCPREQGPVLAAQIAAGGLGVELEHARIAVFLSLGFSLGDYLQARGRIRRPQQAAASVSYVHLVARGTLDERTYKALHKKENVMDSVVSWLREGAPGGDEADAA